MALSLLKHLVQEAELRQLLDFASPTFFKVVPVSELWKTARAIQKEDARAGRAELDTLLTGRMADDVALYPWGAGAPSGATSLADSRSLDEGARQTLGESLLALYFSQLFYGSVSALDLSPDRLFVPAPGASSSKKPYVAHYVASEAGPARTASPRLLWSPRDYFYRWPAPFLSGLRSIYRGFYTDSEATFDEGLRALHLQVAKDAFLKQFGTQQDAVRFRTENLLASLHESFVCCRKANVKLSGAFVALGFYLTTLYQSLECLEVPLDVRRAFTLATGSEPERETPAQQPQPQENPA